VLEYGRAHSTRRYIPERDRSVSMPRREGPAVRAERDGGGRPTVRTQERTVLTRGGIPHPHDRIEARHRGERRAVWSESHSDNGPQWPRSVARSRPVATSQSRTVRSTPPEASVLPPGATASIFTWPVCPRNVARTRPVARSITAMLPSRHPAANIVLSGA
jgi:hypothetical protein